MAHALPPGVWDAETWRRKFGIAWVQTYRNGMGTYGSFSPDGKACGTLDDTIRALPVSEALAAQERAPTMFAEFLADRSKALVDARHSFTFFVGRWGGLRTPTLPATSRSTGRLASEYERLG